jgi:hypothetical protein
LTPAVLAVRFLQALYRCAAGEVPTRSLVEHALGVDGKGEQ